MSFYKQDSGAHVQEKDRTTRCFETLQRPAFCITMILIIVILVVLLLVTLTVIIQILVRKERTILEVRVNSTCLPPWIGFGNKCFYFSEDMGNWTFSHTFCDSQEASLVQIDTSEELTFLKRYKGPDDHWIGLQRESPSHSWKWTDNTGGNIVFHVRGTGEYAYLHDNGLSSGRIYSERKWICSKSIVSTCQIPSNS